MDTAEAVVHGWLQKRKRRAPLLSKTLRQQGCPPNEGFVLFLCL
ncbi:hypothetical protein L541_4619 [Bordetella hinzii CA90 BAL1384]|nr:hypothetical protein L541_4619 [Bordetella hinzii CA90 BAL1384]KCB52142.1 hypothetical protein L537_3224 [Bordetella hinzii 1277]